MKLSKPMIEYLKRVHKYAGRYPTTADTQFSTSRALMNRGLIEYVTGTAESPGSRLVVTELGRETLASLEAAQ